MIKQGPYSVKTLHKQLSRLESRRRKTDGREDIHKLAGIILALPLALGWILYGPHIIKGDFGQIPVWYWTIVILVISNIISAVYYHLKWDALWDEYWELYGKYTKESTTVPLSDIIEHIDMNGRTVIITALSTLSELYYYERSMNDDVDKHLVCTLYADSVRDEYYLRTNGGGRHYLTYEDYMQLINKRRGR